MEFIPASTLKAKLAPVEVLETSMHVECIKDLVQIDFKGNCGYLARVVVSNEVWREFCRRQLACPPPLPKELP